MTDPYDGPSRNSPFFGFRINLPLTDPDPSWVIDQLNPGRSMVQSIQGGAPPVINGFISPLTIDISPINPSYWTYKPT